MSYDFGDESEFHAWHDLTIARMASYDARWEAILNTIEAMGKRVIDDKARMEVKTTLMMDDDSENKSVAILYTTLLQYTKGDAKSKVMSSGMKNAWEAYRYIINKGKTSLWRQSCNGG